MIALAILYDRHRRIPGLDIEVLQDDTWFVSRDDIRRTGIVISLKLTNKSGRRVQITRCRISGYIPRENPTPIYLDGHQKTVEIPFPDHDFYYAGLECYVDPYTTKQMWMYFESRSVHMKSILQAPMTLRDANRKRTRIQIKIPRNMEQVMIYRKLAQQW